MTKQNKFLLKMPIPFTDPLEYQETKFSSISELCDFLEITPNTAYSLRSGRLKLCHNSKKRLEGIIVEKIPFFYSSKKDEKKIADDILKFRMSKTSTKNENVDEM